MSKFHLKSALSFTIFSFFFISQSHITTSSNGDLEGFGESLTLLVAPHEQKLTRIQLYDHNIRTGTPTSFVIVPAANTTGIPSHSDFGAVTVVDDPLTLGLELNTTQVGRLQGIMASADRNEIALFSAFNIEFTGGKYNGSTISIYGRNNVAEPVREFPIIGGSGHFRFATGYAELRTAAISNSEVTLQFILNVLHY